MMWNHGTYNEDRYGFTLVEILITLTVISLMLGVALPTVSSITGARLRSESGRLASAVRFLYDRAVMEHRVQRLVFNLDERQYWAEEADARFVLGKEKSETGLSDGELDEPSSTSMLDAVDQVRSQIRQRSHFTTIGDELGEKYDLPGDLAFQGVWVGHQEETANSGVAYLYFFPSGFTEPSYIYLADEEEVFTLRVSPLTGKVRIYNEFKEAEEDR